MERLTRKVYYDGIHYGSPNGIPCDNLEHLEKVYTKLGQLEDIEEELGIELIPLLKTKKFYVKDNVWNYLKDDDYGISYQKSSRTEIFLQDKYAICFDSKEILLGSKTYKLEDYGKTWALTREELE